MAKNSIESHLKSVGFSDRFIELWWDLSLPSLVTGTPRQVFEQDPARLLEYVKGYSVERESLTA